MSAPFKPVSDTDLVACLDGELPDDRREEVEATLAELPALGARLESWRRQNEVLRAAFSRVANEALPPALSLASPASLRATTGGKAAANPDDPIRTTVRILPRIDRLRRTWRSYLAGVATIAFAGGLLGGLTFVEFADTVPGLVTQPVRALFPHTLRNDFGLRLARRATEAHRTFGKDALRPVEVTQASDIAPWFSRRLGLPVHVPDLTGEGLHLLGGRILPGENGPAGLLLYEAASGERIGLYVARAPGVELAPRFSEDRVASAWFWAKAGAGFAITGPSMRDRLARIAQRVQDGAVIVVATP